MVSCVLFISYSEYVNRYSIISAPDNSVYIFDKKSHALNRCNDSGCKSIETKLPTLSSLGITDQIVSASSKMFGTSEKSMPEEVAKTEAKPAANKEKSKEKTEPDNKNNEEESEDEDNENEGNSEDGVKQKEQVRQIKMKL
jgi:hypothetical protein